MRRLAATALFLSSFAPAAEPWRNKPTSQWSPDEIAELRIHSPWAKPAGVSSQDKASSGTAGRGRSGSYGRMGGYGRYGGGGYGGYGGGGYGGGMGGPGMGGGTIPSGGGSGSKREGRRPEVTLRWESALPMRESAKALGNKAAQQFKAWAEEYYVIAAAGFPLAPDQDMKDNLREATLLKRNAKDSIAPSRVETVDSPDGQLVVFLFPRIWDGKIPDGDLTFEAVMGPLNVTAKFRPKEMSYQGKPSL